MRAVGMEMVMPGDNPRIEIVHDKTIALEVARRFAFREGERTVGSGVVGGVIEWQPSKG